MTSQNSSVHEMEDSIFVRVQSEALDPYLAQLIARHAPAVHQGAQAIFVGAVRGTNLGRRVMGVSYDAFEPLAEAVLREIGHEIQSKWGCETDVVIVHRTGRLNVGEASVVIIVNSPHRAAAFAGSRYAIEQIKVRVPIWKQEHYVEGASDWLSGHALCAHDHQGTDRSFGHHEHPEHQHDVGPVV